MKHLNKKLSVVILIIISLSACSLNKNIVREVPDFAEKYKKLRTYTIVPVEISIYEINADESNNNKEEWNNLAKENLLKSIENEMEDDKISIGRFNETNISNEISIKLRDIRVRYEAVEESILTHTVRGQPQFIQEKLTNFDYSLGPDIKRLNEETDAFLLVRAGAQIATGRRKALKEGTAITKGFLLDVLTAGKVNGAPIFGHPMVDHAFLSMALVDSKSGDILWYNFEFSKKKTKYNLLDADSAQKMVEKVLSNLEED